jgi:hypothetical protein
MSKQEAEVTFEKCGDSLVKLRDDNAGRTDWGDAVLHTPPIVPPVTSTNTVSNSPQISRRQTSSSANSQVAKEIPELDDNLDAELYPLICDEI